MRSMLRNLHSDEVGFLGFNAFALLRIVFCLVDVFASLSFPHCADKCVSTALPACM